MPSSAACRPTPGAPLPVPRAREGSRGTTLSPARPDCTPGTGSSDKPLPDPVTTLRPRPAAHGLVPPAAGTELAIPRSLPPCRRRRRRSRWSARSEARTNDLEVQQDDGHTRPRGRPRARFTRKAKAPEGRSTRRKGHQRNLLTQRLSSCACFRPYPRFRCRDARGDGPARCGRTATIAVGLVQPHGRDRSTATSGNSSGEP